MRGYSLIEMTLSLAIAGIIAAGSIGTFTIVNRSIVQLRTEAQAETKLQRVLSYLVADAQEVGGGPIRPWHALYIHPGDAASKDVDGMLQFTADPDVRPCSVNTYDTALGTVLVDPAADGSCCLRPTPDVDSSEENEPKYIGRFAVLTHNQNSIVLAIQKVPLGGCEAAVEPYLAPEVTPPETFAGSTLSVVDAKWITVDNPTRELRANILTAYAKPTKPPGAVPPDLMKVSNLFAESRVIARNVFDLQLAGGFDLDNNGIIRETASGAGDEWLGNAAGEAGGPWIGDDIIEKGGWLRARYRMLTVGVTIGLPMKIEADRPAVSVFDSPPRSAPRTYLRAATARAMFRNSGIYE